MTLPLLSLRDTGGSSAYRLRSKVVVEQGVDDAGRLQAAPVGVDDRLRGRLRGQGAVAEQPEEQPGLLGRLGVKALAFVGVEHVCRLALRGGERLTQKGDVLAALAVGERGRFVHGFSQRSMWGAGAAGRRLGRRVAAPGPARTGSQRAVPGDIVAVTGWTFPGPLRPRGEARPIDR